VLFGSQPRRLSVVLATRGSKAGELEGTERMGGDPWGSEIRLKRVIYGTLEPRPEQVIWPISRVAAAVLGEFGGETDLMKNRRELCRLQRL